MKTNLKILKHHIWWSYLNPNDRWRPSLSEKTTGERETKAWSGLDEIAGSSCKTRQLHCFELLRLCDESPASRFCRCEIRTSQKKFNDDGNGSMKMLVPIARILVNEDARSSSTLAFVYKWWRQKVFLVFFVEKRVKLLFGEEWA